MKRRIVVGDQPFEGGKPVRKKKAPKPPDKQPINSSESCRCGHRRDEHQGVRHDATLHCQRAYCQCSRFRPEPSPFDQNVHVPPLPHSPPAPVTRQIVDESLRPFGGFDVRPCPDCSHTLAGHLPRQEDHRYHCSGCGCIMTAENFLDEGITRSNRISVHRTLGGGQVIQDFDAPTPQPINPCRCGHGQADHASSGHGDCSLWPCVCLEYDHRSEAVVISPCRCGHPRASHADTGSCECLHPHGSPVEGFGPPPPRCGCRAYLPPPPPIPTGPSPSRRLSESGLFWKKIADLAEESRRRFWGRRTPR